MPVSKNSQSGFSLVELLFAVLILAVGLLGLAELQITAMKANSQSATSTASAALAQQVVEGFASMDGADPIFDAPSTNQPWLGVPPEWNGSPITVAGGGTYDIEYDVAQVESVAGTTDVSNLYQITIRVESNQSLMHVLGNKERNVTTTTLKRAF